MQFWARRVSVVSKVFSTALFHGQARIESSNSSPASTSWFVKVVSTLCVHHSRSLNYLENDYFRENLDPFIAFGAIDHINNRLNKPDLAFRFFRFSRQRLKLIHLESTYDLLLRSLCRLGHHDSVKLVYEYMKTDGYSPNSSILDLIVSSFANAGKYRIAEEMLIAQAEICDEKKERLSSFVYNNFLSILMNKNQIDEAVTFFKCHGLRIRSFFPDTCTFNIVMRGLCRINKVEMAFEFFDVMRMSNCYPDLVTYNTLINGLCKVGKAGRGEELLRVAKVKSGFSPNVVTYTSVISGYCKSGEMNAAAMLFEEMISNGVQPNLFTFNVIIDGFGKKGEVASALKMYERMVNGGFRPDVVTFTSLIDGYCRLGEVGQGMKLWDEMNQRKVPPNVFTFSIIVSALCRVNRLNEARDLLRQLNQRKDIVPPPFVYNPVIDGFCKAGDIDEANAVSAEMEAKGCIHDKMSFTILILGHCMKGRMYEALGLYNKMLSVGCAPDDVTLRCVISCLRKAGMAREANEIELKASNGIHSCSSSSGAGGTTPVGNNMNVTVAV